VFSSIDGSVQRYSADTNRYDLYRAWLISVLYLNTTNPQYFCRVMGSIANTFQSGKYFVIGKFSVLNYLRKNHSECWNQSSEDSYKNDSTQLALQGFDLTHLPPLDSLGLGFLLKSSTPSPTTIGRNYLASFTSSPNPFKNETHLRFHLNRMAYTTIGIYDVLGHQVWGDGNGRSLEAGDHEVVVDGSLLPEGSLYARIETGFGEVRTVKLVKE
ncbi:MAG TPA: T9SS type A sorting domain-containing protein, partial [Candidatus Kapabacteria bacterium]|nr:T9SS type A sorting domain-containing protein [Candidatus Kapabacteria bacterium]